MDKKIFKTLIKKKHKFGKNDYVHGRISGIQLMVCYDDNSRSCSNMEVKEGKIFSIDTTEERYVEFSNIIENMYPGLCIFNY